MRNVLMGFLFLIHGGLYAENIILSCSEGGNAETGRTPPHGLKEKINQEMAKNHMCPTGDKCSLWDDSGQCCDKSSGPGAQHVGDWRCVVNEGLNGCTWWFSHHDGKCTGFLDYEAGNH